MKKIKVNLKDRTYNILIGNKILQKFPAIIRKTIKQDCAIIITTPVIWRYFAGSLRQILIKNRFSAHILSIPDGEKAKSFVYFNRLLNNIAKSATGKKVFIIALGGGVVGDITGFVASVYKRGVPYIQIPTTLLSQIDSSIGGKTAIDLTSGKNLAGSFYQPRLVLIDTNFLKSLPARQIKAGMAEMIKYSLIKDRRFFQYLEKNYANILALKPRNLESGISACVKIKADIVSKDEREIKGLRTLLNFGHTVGHAIETASNYRYNHGESIALGMVAALKISYYLGLIELKNCERITKLISACRLPVRLKNLSHKKILKTMSFDKKFIGRRNRFVLLRDIGKPIIKQNISERIILRALREMYS
jgi:3-dehydroquinate synthase